MKSSLFHNITEGAQEQGHDSKVRLCRVVPADHSDLVVLLEHWRVIEDARGHPDNVVLLVGGLSAVAIDGLRLANQLTGGIIIQGKINAANVEVPAKRINDEISGLIQGRERERRGEETRQELTPPYREWRPRNLQCH